MDVILLTNRTVQAFDISGDEMLHISRAFTPRPDTESENIEQNAIDELFDLCCELAGSGEAVKFYIASVRDVCWKQEITLSEMASLLGHGQWYWETQKSSHEGYAG